VTHLMNSPECSPKRQRTSHSPESSLHQRTAKPESDSTADHLHTPQSPSRMSSSHGEKASLSHTTPTTPPLSAGLSSNMPNTMISGGEGGVSASQDTPMSMSMSRDGDRETHSVQGDVNMSEGSDHRRTDHERQSKTGSLHLLCQTGKALVQSLAPLPC